MTEETKIPREGPLGFRVTPEERVQIAREASAWGVPVSAFVKWRVLRRERLAPPKRRNVTPVKDHQLLTQVLAWFGSSRLPQNLNQLARAANTGTLLVTPDTEAALQRVCHEVMEICRLIRKALGFQEDQP